MTLTLYTRQDPAYKKALLLIILSAIASYMLKHGPQPLVPLITAEFSLSPAQGSLVVAAEMLGMSTVLLLVIILADEAGAAGGHALAGTGHRKAPRCPRADRVQG